MQLVWILVLVALALLPTLGMARMAWRVLRGDEELEPGGSLGRQLFGRPNERRSVEKPPTS